MADALDFSSRWLLATELPRERGAGLYGGAAGIAVVHAYLDRVFQGRGHAERAEAALDAAITLADEQPHGPWLGEGIAGVAWALELLGNHEPDETELDRGLLAALAAPEIGTEWMHGIGGLVAYAVTRPPETAARLGEGLAAAFAREAIRPGPSWPCRFRAALAKDPPSEAPLVDFGLAHGVPGALLALATIVQRGWGGPSVAELLRSASRALLERQLTGHGDGTCLLPANSRSTSPTRLAYCYGDAGASWALSVAARALGDAELLEASSAFALRTAGLRGERLFVRDAGFCHGASGLGHIFARFYAETGDPRFHDAAQHWFARTCSLRAGGSVPFVLDDTLPHHPHPAELLNGVGGIALALATALGGVDHDWDAALLGPS